MKSNLSQNKRAILWLAGGHFTNDIYTGMLNPIMPFIAVKIGISMAVATVILTVSHIFSSLLQPVIGYFADNSYHRFMIFWGLLFSSMFIPLTGITDGIGTLILCIIIGSIGSSLFHPQALGLVSKFSKGLDGAKAISIFMAMGTLGYSIGPIMSAGITQFFGMDKMSALTIIGIIWALLMFKFVPKLSISEEIKEKIHFKKAFKDILSNHKLNILNVIAMLKTVVQSSCFILLPFLWKNIGHKPFYIGLALFMFIFAGGIGSLISSFVEKRIGAKNVFYLSMISTLPMMLLFILTYKDFPILSLVIFVIMGCVTMMATPLTMLMAQNVLPEYKSIIAGFINGFSWGIIAIVMSALGFVAEKFGITNVLLVVAIIPAATSIPLIKKLFKQ